MRTAPVKITAYLLAVIVTYLIAAPLVTQFNLAAIVGLGYEVPVLVRLVTTLQDLAGLIPLYAPVLSLALALAFVFTHYVLGRLINPTLMLFALAGFVAVATAHLTMNAALGLVAVAPVRSYPGLLSQAIAGGLGGAAYWMARDKMQLNQ